MEAIYLQPDSVVYHQGKPYSFKHLIQQEATKKKKALVQSVEGSKRVSPSRLSVWTGKTGFIPLKESSGAVSIHTRKRTLEDTIQKEKKRPRVASKVVGTVNLIDKKYTSRKDYENEQLIEDICEHLYQGKKCYLSTFRVLALDDFQGTDKDENKNKRRLNTFWALVGSGLRKENFYVCNPNLSVFQKIYNDGGKGFPMKVGDCLDNPEFIKKKMHVFYLDYTCKWKSAVKDLRILFSHHDRLMEDKVILHLTLSKRGEPKSKYETMMKDVVSELSEIAESNGFHITTTRPPYTTDKMFKFGFLITRVHP